MILNFVYPEISNSTVEIIFCMSVCMDKTVTVHCFTATGHYSLPYLRQSYNWEVKQPPNDPRHGSTFMFDCYSPLPNTQSNQSLAGKPSTSTGLTQQAPARGMVGSPTAAEAASSVKNSKGKASPYTKHENEYVMIFMIS